MSAAVEVREKGGEKGTVVWRNGGREREREGGKVRRGEKEREKRNYVFVGIRGGKERRKGGRGERGEK